jgi:hypothetical protein
MRQILLFLFFITSLSCSINKYTPQLYQGIRVLHVFPILNTDGTIFNFVDSFEYYVIGNTEVYKMFVLHSFTRIYGDEQTQMPDSIEHEYFVADLQSGKGSLYFKKEIKKAELQTDSFLRIRGINVDSRAIFNDNDSLYSIKKDSRRNIVYAAYIPKEKFDQSYADTSIYYFSYKKFNNKFSLCKPLDSIYKATLSQIVLVYNEAYDVQTKKTHPRREMFYRLSNCTQDKVAEFDFILNDFKKRAIK